MCEEREIILQQLLKYNQKYASPDLLPLGILLKNSNDETVGGLWGRSGNDWLYIELLFVPESLRGRGLGERLVHNAEAVAFNRKCRGVWLQTLSTHALAFYKRLGYSPFGELRDHPKGVDYCFLKKTFDHPPQLTDLAKSSFASPHKVKSLFPEVENSD